MRTVYILRCSDDSLYTGITTDLERRIHEHNHNPLWAKYTKARRPVSLVRSGDAADRSEASSLEYKIKKMTRAQKELHIMPQ